MQNQTSINNNYSATFMQEMMQLFIKHHNINANISDQSSVNNVMLVNLNAAATEYQAKQKSILKESSFNRSVKHRIKYAVNFLGAETLVCNIKEADAERLINSKNEKPYEREQLRKLCNKMFDDFVSHSYTLSNPFAKLKKQKIQSGEIVLIDKNHFWQIVDFIKNNYEKNRAEFYIDILILLVQTALRPGELLSIIKRNILINELEEIASLQITSTKNYKTRIVPAVGEAYNIIVKYFIQTKTFDDYLFPGRKIFIKDDSGKPIKDAKGKFKFIFNHYSINTISKVFKNACKKLKLPSNYCLYALRATCASELYSKGQPLQDIARLLGHQNSLVTEAYYSRFNSVNNASLISVLKESEINIMFNKIKKVV